MEEVDHLPDGEVVEIAIATGRSQVAFGDRYRIPGCESRAEGEVTYADPGDDAEAGDAAAEPGDEAHDCLELYGVEDCLLVRVGRGEERRRKKRRGGGVVGGGRRNGGRSLEGVEEGGRSTRKRKEKIRITRDKY